MQQPNNSPKIIMQFDNSNIDKQHATVISSKSTKIENMHNQSMLSNIYYTSQNSKNAY